MNTKTRLPEGVNSVMSGFWPQDMTQLPVGSFPALPQQGDVRFGDAVSLTSSMSVAVLAPSLMRYITPRGGRPRLLPLSWSVT